MAKHCSKCSGFKNLTAFYVDNSKSDGRTTLCKQCIKTRHDGSVVTSGTKLCSKCKETKAVDDFGIDKSKKDGRPSWCKQCHNQFSRTYYKTDAGIKSARNRNLKHRFGITSEDYGSMYVEQKGKCAICGIHQFELSCRLAVDHDHKTGKVRGLLCSDCNLALGNFKDSLESLKKAIMYIANS